MKQILVTLTDLTVPLALRFPETARYFPPHDPDAPRAAIASLASLAKSALCHFFFSSAWTVT